MTVKSAPFRHDTLPGGVTDVAACQRAARHVLENGAMDIVVVHCPVIAIAVTRDGKIFTKPSTQIPRELVAGANGAGDAFAAGMLYGVHEGWSVDDALTSCACIGGGLVAQSFHHGCGGTVAQMP